MTNAEFERLLEMSVKNFGADYIDHSEDMSMPHEFSPKFERRMNKLIRRQKKPYYFLISTPGRRAACTAAAAVIAISASMPVKAVREQYKELIVEHFDGYDKIGIAADSGASTYDVIEQEYMIDVPEGFVLDEENSYKYNNDIYLSYINGEKFIAFNQCVPYDFNYLIDNETSQSEYYADENGVLYTIYSWGNDLYYIYWENNGYIFLVHSNCDKDFLVDLCIHTKEK